MSKADKMLEALGFEEYMFQRHGELVYQGEKGQLIFFEDIRNVRVPVPSPDIAEHSYRLYIAVYLKMKELGWFE